jgi:hypothetical protein
MTTAADILKKVKIRKDKGSKKFQPDTHRAWDYINKQPDENMIKIEQYKNEPENKKESRNNHEQNRDQQYKNMEFQMEHKPDTNGTQMEHKPNTNGTQMEHKPNTNGTQMEHKWNTNLTQMEHKPDTNGTQTRHKWNTKHNIFSLTGIQKQLLIFLYLSCKKSCPHITEEFSLANIANTLKIRPGSVKNSLRRLEEKHFIKNVMFKNGRGGWSKFELPDNIFRDLLESEMEHKLDTNLTQTRHKLDTNAPLSSSSYITTTTTDLNPEWDFDVTNFEKFGFTKSHLRQLMSLNKISAKDIEQSLIEFSYDLENNFLPNIKTSKINMLMGLFRAGQTYTSGNYRTEQEQLIKLMVERAEKRKKALFDEKLMAWIDTLTENEERKITAKMPTHLTVLYHAHNIKNPEVKNWISENYGELISNFANPDV